MKFEAPLINGTLQQRYKRFLADVTLKNKDEVTAHCPNTGAMTGCAEPGFEVWLSSSDNPKRKYKHTWELAQNQRKEWIGINTGRANKLSVEAINGGIIAELQGYANLQQEVRYGEENSRIDILLTDPNKEDCFVEVKSVTLLDETSSDGQGLFPDTVTTRGQKHLRELIHIAKQGKRAVLLFLAQHTGIKKIAPASQIDPKYSELIAEALASGVEILSYGTHISETQIYVEKSLPFQSKNIVNT